MERLLQSSINDPVLLFLARAFTAPLCIWQLHTNQTKRRGLGAVFPLLHQVPFNLCPLSPFYLNYCSSSFPSSNIFLHQSKLIKLLPLLPMQQLFEEDMSSTTSTCHGDFIPGYNPQMPFLKLLQSALEEVTPLSCHSHMQHYLNFQDYRSYSDVKPKIEQMDSCITHDAPPLLPPPTMCNPSRGAADMPKPRRKKRPRTSPAKKPEEAECQRRTHITVERNRRRLMNEYFATLKSLIPPYLVQRGDQASIVGGAIHFVKDLEQQVLSLQAEKRSRAAGTSMPTLEGFFISPQYKGYSCCRGEGGVDVEATVVQGHINLKVAGRKQSHHLLTLISALQELKMTVLHLMLTAIDARSMLYCFSLKMEEGCRLGSADEIAAAVHHIFSYYSDC